MFYYRIYYPNTLRFCPPLPPPSRGYQEDILRKKRKKKFEYINSFFFV